MTAKDRDAQTIRCEGCAGDGRIQFMRDVAVCCGNATPWGECCGNPVGGQVEDFDVCPLCSGTGREPSTVTPRNTEKTP